MADILKFPDKPGKRSPARPAGANPPAAKPDALASGQYFCTQCDGDTFRLTAVGTIHCAKCGARMLNIVVAGTSD